MISKIFKPKETAKRSNAKEATCAAEASVPKDARAPFKCHPQCLDIVAFAQQQ